MLRRKMLLNFAPLVVILVATAITIIWLLQGVLQDLRHINNNSWVLVEQVNGLSVDINAVEIDLYEIRLGKERHLDRLVDTLASVKEAIEKIGGNYVMTSEAMPAYRDIIEALPEFEQHVGALATAQNADQAQIHNDAALNIALQLRRDTLPLSRVVQAHAHREQEELVSWFRWLVLALGLAFLLEINLTIVVTLRMAAAVLEPVDKLINATRELAAGHYDYRVKVAQQDEFDELARAYNALAENLQSNEARKMEVLRQVALAMNHELNNAAAIIHVQLQRINRDAAGNPALEDRLRQIQTSLLRMTQSVQCLGNARRIVLTEYTPGMKMLDLTKSAAP